MRLSEEGAQCLFDFAHGVQFYLQFALVQALHVVAGDDDVLESQLLCLLHALFYAAYGSHLSAQSYLSAYTPAALERGVDVAGEHGGYDAEVHGEVGDAQPAGNVDEDVLLHQLEAYALLEHGQQHVQPALVEAGGLALGRAVGGGGDEGLRLEQEGSHSLDGRADGDAREPFVLLGEEQLGGVGDLSQARGLHLVDAQLRGRPEAVLHRAQYAVHVVLVALELYDGVHDVLQYLRSGQGTLLGDVPNEDDGHAAGLGEAQQRRGALAHLGYASGARLHLVGGDGLYGVYYE